MNKKVGILLILLLLLALNISFNGNIIPLTNAISCGTLPSSISGLIIACYPTNIVNTQSSPTIANFNLGFNALPFNALAGNVVLYNSISGALIPAWVENSSLIWVNMRANTIAGQSSVNGIYYFGLGATNTNFFLGTNDIGINPLYANIYGQYDNGGNVFTLYQNFTGTITPSAWTYTTSSTATIIQNNGLILGGGSSGYAFLQTTSSGYGLTENTILDTEVNPEGYSNGAVNDNSWIGYIDGATTAVSAHNIVVVVPSGDNNVIVATQITSGADLGTLSTTNGFKYHVFSVQWYNTSSASFYDNYYQNEVTLSSDILTTQENIGVATGNPNFPILPSNIVWFRERIAPPNNIMPQVHYNTTTSVTTTTSTSTTTTSTGTTTSTSTTTTSTGTTTSIIPTTTINAHGLNQTSIFGFIGLDFNVIPYFAYGILLLSFFLILVRTKRLSMSLLGCALVSYLLLALGALTLNISALITIVFIFVTIYELFQKGN